MCAPVLVSKPTMMIRLSIIVGVILCLVCMVCAKPMHFTLQRQGTSRKMMARAQQGEPAYTRMRDANTHGFHLNQRSALVKQRREAHRAANTRARLSVVDDTTTPQPLSGCPFADFTIPVQIGASTFQLLIDTGSSTLAVVGDRCSTCTGISPRWTATPGVSISQTRTTRGAYGDNTGWRGSVWQDRVTVGERNATMRMSVIDAQSTPGYNADGSPNSDANTFFVVDMCNNHVETFLTQYTTQGIIGFAFPRLASGGTDSFPATVFAQHADLDKTFAIQMCAGSGNLWIGGSDAAMYTHEPLYTPVAPNAAYWSIQPMDIRIAGEPLNLTYATDFAPYPIHIVDSGTTMWDLPTHVYKRVINVLLAHPVIQRAFRSSPTNNFFEHSSGWCETTADGSTWHALQLELPTITLVLANGVHLTMDGVGSYLLPCNNDYTQWTPGISPSDMGTIGGWPLMNQFVVFHDMANMRMGFAPTQGCTTGRHTRRTRVAMTPPQSYTLDTTMSRSTVTLSAAHARTMYLVLPALASIATSVYTTFF
jgi:hypothetical protein